MIDIFGRIRLVSGKFPPDCLMIDADLGISVRRSIVTIWVTGWSIVFSAAMERPYGVWPPFVIKTRYMEHASLFPVPSFSFLPRSSSPLG